MKCEILFAWMFYTKSMDWKCACTVQPSLCEGPQWTHVKHIIQSRVKCGLFCIASHYAKLDAVGAILVVANVSYDARFRWHPAQFLPGWTKKKHTVQKKPFQSQITVNLINMIWNLKSLRGNGLSPTVLESPFKWQCIGTNFMFCFSSSFIFSGIFFCFPCIRMCAIDVGENALVRYSMSSFQMSLSFSFSFCYEFDRCIHDDYGLFHFVFVCHSKQEY